MTKDTVGSVLSMMNIPVVRVPEGFLLGLDRKTKVDNGNSAFGPRLWQFSQIDSPFETTPYVSTARGLRKLVREWLAGKRPVDRPGFDLYCKPQGDLYTWAYRRVQARP